VSVARPDHDAQDQRARDRQPAPGALEHRHADRLQLDRRCDLRRVRPAPRRKTRRDCRSRRTGTSKLAAEEYLATFNRLYGTRHVSLRYGNVYGPRQDPHGEAGVVSIFLDRSSPASRRRSSATALRPATTSTWATLRARRWPPARTWRRLQRRHRPRDLGRRAPRAVPADRRDRSSRPEFVAARPGELQRSVLDPSRAVDELGWRPEHSLEDGLRETYEFFRG
jgi:UDP-glucose 4-epimerase